MYPDAKKVQAVVDSIVRTSAPQKVILFGSAARGDMHEESDLDFLVIKDHHLPGRIRNNLYTAKPLVGIDVDICVATPEEVEANRKHAGRLETVAENEGVVLYECETVTRRRVEEQDVNGLDRFNPDDAREWVNWAEEDLRIAKGWKPFRYLESYAFMAQQAGEKALKGMLAKHGETPPRSHDVVELHTKVTGHGVRAIPSEALLGRMTGYATGKRYPSMTPRVTVAEYVETLTIAQEIVDRAVLEVFTETERDERKRAQTFPRALSAQEERAGQYVRKNVRAMNAASRARRKPVRQGGWER